MVAVEMQLAPGRRGRPWRVVPLRRHTDEQKLSR
jgi:hypothetical protein